MAYNKESYQKNKKSKYEAVRKWQLANPGKIRVLRRKASNKYHLKLKAAFIQAYGGKCSCCGETEPRFLTLEHINHDGIEHRKKIGFGMQMLLHLRKLGWPQEGLTILCMNCNFATKHENTCPHKIGDDKDLTPK